MASTIKVDKIEGSTGSTVTVPTGQTFTVTDGIAIGNLPTITAVKGGTNQTTWATGDLLYANGADTLTKLTKPGSTLFLQMTSAGVPSWAAAGGGLQSTQQFSASGTWTKPAGITQIRVFCTGGGGSGGGGGTGSGDYGSGGGAGGTAIELLDATSLTSETVTIGLGGTTASGASSGVTGGASSFGSLCSATGGELGKHGNASYVKGGEGGIGSGGDINSTGQGGGGGDNNGTADCAGGTGGSSYFGGGGRGSAESAAQAGAGTYGAGGGGGATNGTGTPSGAGGEGFVYVEEYA